MKNNYSSINSDTRRILAQGIEASNNTWETGLNNNDLIIGPSGAGKTRGYVKPNILQCTESMVVADTKGNLMEQVGPALEKNGYKVHRLDLKDLKKSTIGYNPLDYVRKDENGRYNEQDLMMLANVLVPESMISKKDPFWDYAAKMYIESILAYIMECLPPEEKNLCTAVRMLEEMPTGRFYALMDEHDLAFPNSTAARLYRLYKTNRVAERMEASIIGITSEKLTPFMSVELERLFTMKERLDFWALGREKTALFLCVSDTDRSMDRVVSFLYTQALHELCRCAETYPGQCLPVPVRFILDDFATNAVVPNFQELTSVIRSRGVSVSIILQSMTQLAGIYGENDALTIANNCDHWIYLGGQDLYTAHLIARRADKREQRILEMEPRQLCVLARGEKALFAGTYNLEEHPRYIQMPGGTPEGVQSMGARLFTGVERAEPLLAEG